MYNKYLSVLVISLGMAFSLDVQAACNANITATAPDSRYTDNGDGTVTDKKTGLVWKQCSEGLSSTVTACDSGSIASYSWQEALQLAKTLNDGGGFAGKTDWRLPNHKELASLVEYQCYNPAINETLFPNTSMYNYWSSTPSPSGDLRAWTVDFGDGDVMSGSRIANPNRVRLVRGGL